MLTRVGWLDQYPARAFNCEGTDRGTSLDYSWIRAMIAPDLGYTRLFAIEGIAGSIAE
jgi:hypothetical protein